MLNLLKILMLITYCNLTLNGEFGLSIFLTMLIVLAETHLLIKLNAILALLSLVFITSTIIRKQIKNEITKYILAGLGLLSFMFWYCDQPQEHDNPFDFSKWFIWQVLVFLLLYFAVLLILLQKKKKNSIMTAKNGNTTKPL